MRLPIIHLFIFISLFQFSAHGSETSTLNSSVRALGMGDAFTAVANDDSSMFYNPAGLARVKGLNWKVFSVDAGTSGVNDYKNLSNVKGASGGGFAQDVSSLYGDHPWVGVGAESMFTMPMLGVGVFDHSSGLVQVDNPVYPQVHARVINDYGYVMGLGVPLTPFLHVGADVKYIKRTGTDTIFGPSAIADLQPKEIVGSVTGWGVGYGADLGMTALLPAPFFTAALSTSWRNLGGIQFKSANNSNIPSEPNNITVGSAFIFDLPLITITPALDFVYLNDADLQLTRKINFGVEVALPVLSLRAGFHEGYYTAGVGMNLGLFRVDAATYGVELGDYPGQIEDRRYVLQFTMKLGVGNFSATPDDKKGSGAGKGVDSGNESIWGSGRLKQRR